MPPCCVCSWPTKCHASAGRRSAAALAAASWSRFSPMSVTPRAASRRTSSAGQVLVTAMRVTSSGRRPAIRQAASIRARTSARLAASSARDRRSTLMAIRLSRRQPGEAGEPAGDTVAAVGVVAIVLDGARRVDGDRPDAGP